MLSMLSDHVEALIATNGLTFGRKETCIDDYKQVIQ